MKTIIVRCSVIRGGYYHSFLVGVFVGRGYNVESHKEKGLGDRILKPNIRFYDEQQGKVIQQ